MASTFYSPPYIPLQKSYPNMKPVHKFMILKKSQLPINNRSYSRQIRSCLRNKVYEDESEGIICYTTDNGEIVCEGYDEGPRFQQRTSKTSYGLRDAEILNIIEEKYLKFVNGGEFININGNKNATTHQQDLNWKWL